MLIRRLDSYNCSEPVYGGDYSLVSDPTFDAYYPAAVAATDITQIKSIVSQANLYVAQQHFGVSIVSPNFYSFVQPWLKGLQW